MKLPTYSTDFSTEPLRETVEKRGLQAYPEAAEQGFPQLSVEFVDNRRDLSTVFPSMIFPTREAARQQRACRSRSLRSSGLSSVKRSFRLSPQRTHSKTHPTHVPPETHSMPVRRSSRRYLRKEPAAACRTESRAARQMPPQRA